MERLTGHGLALNGLTLLTSLPILVMDVLMPINLTPAERQARHLRAIQQLLEIEEVTLVPALMAAAARLVPVFMADKADVFIFQPEHKVLQSLGVSDTPMGRRQVELGLDRVPLAGGGLVVGVFQSGRSLATGHADRSPRDLDGIVEGLGVRSELLVPLPIAGNRRGVLSVVSAREDWFVPDEDLPLLQSVAGWVGVVAHRSELVEGLEAKAFATGRLEAANELLTPRQWEVAELVADGLTNEQIGEKLFITKGSVANHIERIFQRLGAVRRAEIAAWVSSERAQLRQGGAGKDKPKA